MRELSCPTRLPEVATPKILVPFNRNFAVVDWSPLCAVAPQGSVLTHYTLTSKLVLLAALETGARLSSKLKTRYINLLFYI